MKRTLQVCCPKRQIARAGHYTHARPCHRPSLGLPWTILNLYWLILGLSKTILGLILERLGTFWAACGCLISIWASLGPPWLVLACHRPSWGSSWMDVSRFGWIVAVPGYFGWASLDHIYFNRTFRRRLPWMGGVRIILMQFR